MGLLTLQDFAGAANQTFDLAIGEATATLTLVEITPLQAATVEGLMRAPFSLMFRNASPVILPQRTYRMVHAAMGAFDIFLVPVARDAQGVLYQAVFN